MKLWLSLIASAFLSFAAGSAVADIAPDPCKMGEPEGSACTTPAGKPGTCVSGVCQETSGAGGGGGAGGSGGSGEGGSAGSAGGGDDESGCSLRAVGSAGAAGGAAVAMVAAGALLLLRRRRR